VLGGTCTAAPSFIIGIERTGDRTPQGAQNPAPKDKRADWHTSPDRASPAAMSVLEKLVGLRRVATLSGGADASWEKLQNDPADVAEVWPKPSVGGRKSCPNGRNCRACGLGRT